MRLLAALLLLLFTAPATAAIDSLARDSEARWVRFELTAANQIRFRAMLDDKPVAAILDTGVSASVVSRRYAATARLTVRPGGGAVAIGGIVANGWADPKILVLGGLTRRNPRLAVTDLPSNATGGAAVDLLIGRDVTAAYALDIDYDARRFRLLPSGRMPFAGSIAPLSIGGEYPVYVTEISVGRQRLRRIVVDTGDGGSLTLAPGTWATLPALGVTLTTTLVFGIGGASVMDFAVLPELRSGPLMVKDVETAIERPGGFSQAIGMAGRIGSGLLRRYRVLLDPGAGRLVLAPGARAGVSPIRSTSGLLLAPESGKLRVLHVMRDSPAAATGWRAGEEICQVDGKPVDASAAANGWTSEREGRTVTLGMCRGGARSLTLRRFY